MFAETEGTSYLKKEQSARPIPVGSDTVEGQQDTTGGDAEWSEGEGKKDGKTKGRVRTKRQYINFPGEESKPSEYEWDNSKPEWSSPGNVDDGLFDDYSDYGGNSYDEFPNYGGYPNGEQEFGNRPGNGFYGQGEFGGGPPPFGRPPRR